MKFEIGDIVKIREYEDLCVEYGCDEVGDIEGVPGGCWFVRDMRKYCGSIFRIKRWKVTEEYKSLYPDGAYELEDLETSDEISEYCFSDYMFEEDFVFNEDEAESVGGNSQLPSFEDFL